LEKVPGVVGKVVVATGEINGLPIAGLGLLEKEEEEDMVAGRRSGYKCRPRVPNRNFVVIVY